MNIEISRSFGQALRTIRQESKKSLDDVFALSWVMVDELKKIEEGRTPLTAESLKQVQKAYGLTTPQVVRLWQNCSLLWICERAGLGGNFPRQEISWGDHEATFLS